MSPDENQVLYQPLTIVHVICLRAPKEQQKVLVIFFVYQVILSLKSPNISVMLSILY